MTLLPEDLLLIGALLMFVSVLASKLGGRLGVPSLLLFLFVGMAFGVDGLGIHFNDPLSAQFIAMLALCIILFSGGMDTKYREIKPIWKEGAVLATLGVVLTMLITGVFIYYAAYFLSDTVNLTWAESMLLAAVMSSTDSASVFNLLRSKGLKLSQNMRPTLELESGSNDPMAYLLTIVLIDYIKSGDLGVGYFASTFVIQMTVGALLGYALGKFAAFAMNRINLDNQSIYSVFLMTWVFFIYAVTTKLHGNGYLAVYLAGLVIGNGKMVHKKSIANFFDGFTWLWQIMVFLTLGLLVTPKNLLVIAPLGLVIGVFMILVGRPASVFLCLIPFKRVTVPARWFISWVGLRGAVPIIFATYPLIAKVNNADLIFDIVFFITILSLLVQGTTIPFVAGKLGLISDEEEHRDDFGFEMSEEIKSAMTEVIVSDSVLVNGDMLYNIVLPDNTLVVMVKRHDKYFVPRGNTKLEVHDKLLLISDNDEELRKACEEFGAKYYNITKNH